MRHRCQILLILLCFVCALSPLHRVCRTLLLIVTATTVLHADPVEGASSFLQVNTMPADVEHLQYPRSELRDIPLLHSLFTLATKYRCEPIPSPPGARMHEPFFGETSCPPMFRTSNARPPNFKFGEFSTFPSPSLCFSLGSPTRDICCYGRSTDRTAA
jgi:hypothetical protein